MSDNQTLTNPQPKPIVKVAKVCSVQTDPLPTPKPIMIKPKKKDMSTKNTQTNLEPEATGGPLAKAALACKKCLVRDS
jgi:hypothetical protein